jgi:hypothetical protein
VEEEALEVLAEEVLVVADRAVVGKKYSRPGSSIGLLQQKLNKEKVGIKNKNLSNKRGFVFQ